MAKNCISPQSAEALRANPNVERVTAKTVVFKPAFVEYALGQHLNAGRARIDIFKDAGIDVESLGRDRLAATFGNWLTKRKNGLPAGKPPGRQTAKERTEVEELRAENAKLRMAVGLYRQISRPDRRHQPRKQPPGNSKP